MRLEEQERIRRAVAEVRAGLNHSPPNRSKSVRGLLSRALLVAINAALVGALLLEVLT
jgi:hypothetical protein